MADLQMPTSLLTTEDLGRIEVPCLVLSGSASLPWFQDIAKMVAGAIPHCALKAIDGAGHAMYAARPTEFAQAVRDSQWRCESRCRCGSGAVDPTLSSGEGRRRYGPV